MQIGLGRLTIFAYLERSTSLVSTGRGSPIQGFGEDAKLALPIAGNSAAAKTGQQVALFGWDIIDGGCKVYSGRDRRGAGAARYIKELGLF